MDVGRKVSRGFGFVTFLFPSDAFQAFIKLDKTDFMGRLLHILPGQEAPEPQKPTTKSNDHQAGNEFSNNPSTSFQSSRFQQLKQSASVGHNWNALFVRPDAVASYLAAKFGLSKEQVLSSSSSKTGSSVAVRLAQAEIQLVNEMRDFLLANGVLLDAFAKPTNEESVDQGRRSKLEVKSTTAPRQLSGTAFLIKNLPVGTSEPKLRQLFSRFIGGDGGGVKRIILPPLGITAIIEFSASHQARAAFKALAYESYQDNILYLQWLPQDALTSSTTSNSETVSIDSSQQSTEPSKKSRKRKHQHSPTDNSKSADSSADVDQNNFDLPDDEVGNEVGESIDDEPVATSPATPVSNQPLSGRRARNYINKKARLAQEAVSATDIDASSNHASVSESTNQSDACVSESTNQSAPVVSANHTESAQSTTLSKSRNPVLIVRNVAFQANEREVGQLFEPFAGGDRKGGQKKQLISVRMPKKPSSGGHKGFAFVEFPTYDLAKSAFDAMATDTHFFGRRLRMEFANK